MDDPARPVATYAPPPTRPPRHTRTARRAAPQRAWARLPRAARILAAGAVLFATGAGAGIIGIVTQPAVAGTAGPLEVTVDPQWSRAGGTTIDLGAGGSLHAATHDGPVSAVTRIEHVDVPAARNLAEAAATNPDAAATTLRGPVTDGLTDLADTLARRSLAAAALAGAAAGMLLPRRRAVTVATTTIAAVTTATVLGAVTWTSFDADAFDEPDFTGPVSHVPELIGTVTAHISSIDDVEGRLGELSARLSGLYLDLEPLDGAADETVIAHVSDIHSNPIGLELLDNVAADFDVDAIIDTGDLTSFGATDVEANVLSIAGRLAASHDLDYFFVPGNHDSDTLRGLADDAGLTVVDGRPVRVAGTLTLTGLADLSYTASNQLSAAQQDANNQIMSTRLADTARTHRSDIVAIHNPAAAHATYGHAPLILSGHTHRPAVDYHDGTVHVTAGTSGAGGLEALQTGDDTDYELSLLRFRDRTLVAVDNLTFTGTDGAFRFERTLIDPDRATIAAPARLGADDRRRPR